MARTRLKCSIFALAFSLFACAGCGSLAGHDEADMTSETGANDKCRDRDGRDVCSIWKDRDCEQAEKEYGLSRNEAKKLVRRCAKSCGLCTSGTSADASDCGDGKCGSAKGKPNVVFILADDLGFGDLGAYGHPYSKTPNLDKLAKDGTRFERFYATGVTCAPSRTGFMTSRHPASFKNYPARLGYGSATTVTDILSKEAGYATAHFGKWHMGEEKDARDGTYGINDVHIMGSDKPHEKGRDFPIAEAAANWIMDHRNEAFYVNVWFHSTHFPVNPAKSLANQFSNVKCKRSDFPFNMQERFDACEKVGGSIVSGMQNYLGDVHGVDMNVGLLLKAIDDAGVAKNTIVVFSSDQGPGVPGKHGKASENMLGFSGGLRGGKHDQYEGGVRVPMIIRWPGKVPAGKVNKNSIFSALDWLPTLASIAGAKAGGSGFEGEDVTDIWKGASRSRRKPLFWRTSSSNAEATMLDGNWKLHVAKKGKKIELYDLSSDEEERKNVASKNPQVATRMSQELNRWLKTLPNSYNK